MKRAMKYLVTAIALAAVLGAATGCTRVRLQDDPTTRTSTENETIDLQGATSLAATIEQGVGELRIRPSLESTGAVTTVFTYAPESWKPESSSSVEGTAATLTIRQPSQTDVPVFSNTKNSWTIDLPHGVATDLSLRLGVGTSNVDLRGIDLTGLDVVTGVGSTTVDLSGARSRSVTGHVEAGVGDLTIRLPRNVGVRVTSEKDGIGHLSAAGFTESGNEWTNAAWTGEGPSIDITLTRGVGDISLVLVD